MKPKPMHIIRANTMRQTQASMPVEFASPPQTPPNQRSVAERRRPLMPCNTGSFG